MKNQTRRSALYPIRAVLLLLVCSLLLTGCANSFYKGTGGQYTTCSAVRSDTDIFDLDNVTLEWHFSVSRRYDVVPETGEIILEPETPFDLYFCVDRETRFFIKRVEDAFDRKKYRCDTKDKHAEGFWETYTVPREVFVEAHNMVGQHIQGLDIGKSADECTQLAQPVGIIRDTGNHHMADPDRYLFLFQILCKSQNACIVMTGEFFMGLRIHVLDVQHHKIRHFHQLIQLLIVGRRTGTVGYTGCIQTSVDILLLRQTEELQHKVQLHQRLTAGDSNAAFGIEGCVSFILPDQGLGRTQRTCVHFPGVRIMAILAAHGTALEKNHKPYTGAIHRAKAFRGVVMS